MIPFDLFDLIHCNLGPTEVKGLCLKLSCAVTTYNC